MTAVSVTMTTRKFLKITGLAVAAALVLLLLAAVAIAVLVDPNDFRDDIIETVQAATGRELVIEGDLDLSLFPWLGLSMGATRLGNAPAFIAAGGEKNFARVAAVDIRVKLLPLLRHRLVTKTLHLRGLRVNLQRGVDGRNNWQDLLGTPADEAKPASGSETRASPAPALALAIGGVEVSDAQLVWNDRQAGQRIDVDRLSLHTGPVALDSPIDFSLSAQLGVAQPALQTPVTLRGRLTADPQAQTYHLEGLALGVAVEGAALPVSPLALHLGGDTMVDLARQQVQISNLQLQSLGLTLSAQAEAQLQSMEAKGRLSVASFSPRELSRKLAIELPKTSDPKVLNRAAVKLDFSASPAAVNLTNIDLRLDDSQLTGKLALQDFSRQALRFALQLDDIDVDRYLPAASAAPPPEPTAVAAAGSQLPLDLLRGLDVQGDLRVNRLKVANARVSDALLGVKAKDGVIRLSPLQAKLYQGEFHGKLALDARGDMPKISVNETLKAVHIGPLLEDVLGENKVSGVANLSAALTAEGGSPEAITRTLTGTARFSFLDGAVSGVNLGQLIRQAYAKLKKQPAPPKATLKTDFAEMSGSVSIRNGIVHNQDLRASSPALRVAGRGTLDLPGHGIDYVLQTSIVESDQGQGGRDLSELKALTVPIKIVGSFENPKIKLDLAPLLKAKAKVKLNKEKAKLKSEAKQKLEKKKTELKEKLEEQVKDKLKGLFR